MGLTMDSFRKASVHSAQRWLTLMFLGLHVVCSGLLSLGSVSANPLFDDLVPLPIAELNTGDGSEVQAKALCEYARKNKGRYHSTAERIHKIPEHGMWIIVCENEPGWWEEVWVAVAGEQKNRMERYVSLPLHGNIISGIDIYMCPSGVGAMIEIRHTTHMGTRTRSIFSTNASGEGLAFVHEWRRYGRSYPPDDYVRCAPDQNNDLVTTRNRSQPEPVDSGN